MTKNKTLKQVLADSWKSKSPARSVLLREMEAGAISPDLEVDGVPMEATADEAPSDENSLKSAIRAAVIAVFDDDTLDSAATMKAIGKILKLHGEVTAQPKEDEGAGDEETTEDESILAATESLKREIQTLKSERSCRVLLEKAGVAADEELVQSLASLSAAQQKVMVDRLKTTNPGDDWPRPATSPPIREKYESGSGEDEYYESTWTEKLKSGK